MVENTTPQEEVIKQPPITSKPLPTPVKPNKAPMIVMVVVTTLSLLLSGYFVYQNIQLKKQITQPTSPTVTTETSDLTTDWKTYNDNVSNFSLKYPNSWKLLDRSIDDDFPLKNRLSSSSKAIALEKDGIYLIITIERETGGESGGIFVADGEYVEFTANKSKVVIVDKDYYLSKSHPSISTLEQSHSGSYGWGSFFEIIPNKIVPSGESFIGYENVIHKSGYEYNFILVGQDDSASPPEIQSNLIEILKTIVW